MEILGAGTVEKRGKDKWRLRITVKDNKGVTERLDKTIIARNKTEAKVLMEQWKRELTDADLEHRAKSITVEEFMVMFMDYCKNTRGCAKRTLAGYDQMIRCRIDPHLGHVLLSDLTPYMLEEFFTQQRESGGANGGALSANTNRKTFSMFKTALKHAVYLELIPKNPLELLQGPSVKKSQAQHPLTEEGLMRVYELLKGCPDRQFVIAVRLVAATGMRRGEICGLSWGDVDMETGEITVHVSLSEISKSMSDTGKSSIELKETKTTGSTRKITLDKDTLAFLREEKEAQRRTLAYYHVEQTDKTPVACDFKGEPYRPSCLTSDWIAFRNDHDFEGVRLHDLRHTQATLLLKHGEDILTVSRRMGHAKPSTTLDVYGHVMPGMDKEAADLFGRIAAGME